MWMRLFKLFGHNKQFSQVTTIRIQIALELCGNLRWPYRRPTSRLFVRHLSFTFMAEMLIQIVFGCNNCGVKFSCLPSNMLLLKSGFTYSCRGLDFGIISNLTDESIQIMSISNYYCIRFGWIQIKFVTFLWFWIEESTTKVLFLYIYFVHLNCFQLYSIFGP